MKNELKEGMILENRAGERLLLFSGRLLGKSGWEKLESFDDGLRNKTGNSKLDIVKIFRRKREKLFNINALFEDGNLKLIYIAEDNEKH